MASPGQGRAGRVIMAAGSGPLTSREREPGRVTTPTDLPLVMPAVDTSVTIDDGPQPSQDPGFAEVEVDPADSVEVPV